MVAELDVLSRHDSVEVKSGDNAGAVEGSIVDNADVDWETIVLMLVLAKLGSVEVEADGDGRSCEKSRVFDEWNGAVEIVNSVSAYLSLSISLVIVFVLSELDVLAELDVRTMLDVLTELGAAGVETNDNVRPAEGSYAGHAPGSWGWEVIALVLAKLNVLTKLKAGEVKAAEFKAIVVEANDDVRAIEDA
jgi:hypothetical protein